jgi:hypothetical protein
VRITLVPTVAKSDGHNHWHAKDERNGSVRHLQIDEPAVDEPTHAGSECDQTYEH